MSSPEDQLSELTNEQRRALLADLLREKARQTSHSLPASDGQRAQWFVYQTAPDSSAYHVVFSTRICSPVDASDLRKAAQAITNRHPTLRTTYALSENQLTQIVHGYQDVNFEIIDASTWDEDELYRQVLAAYRRPFDLENGPIARWQLFSVHPRNQILMFTAHHIALDAWSLWLLLEDLRLGLHNLTQRLPIAPISAPKPYTDWTLWQAEMLASAEGQQHKEYWQQTLAGDLPTLNLPLDFPRPAMQTYNGASITFAIPAEKTRYIRALANSQDVTLYMFLLAVYQLLLRGYTGQDEILIGTPTSGRNLEEYRATVGYFINPVVLRGDLSGNPHFDSYLGQVRKAVLGALAHQDYPFIRVVEHLKIRPDPSRSPVFQCMFNLLDVQKTDEVAKLVNQNEPGKTVDFGGITLAPYFFPQEEGQFELALELLDTGETLVCTLKYNTDLFCKQTAENLRYSFEYLLEQILTDPLAQVDTFQILNPQERQRILVDWNQTQSDYPRDLRAHQLFEAQAERTPDAVAVEYDHQILTYAQLNNRANQFAHALRGLGAGPDYLVGIYLERSLEMVVALLGVLKSGAAYVPMDPIFPPQRIQFMIEDTHMPVIITQQSLVDTLPQTESTLLLMDAGDAGLSGQPQTNPQPAGDAESLAYVIFTSGSTGRPKGVQIPHRALVNFLVAMQQQPGIRPDDVLAAVTTLSFDIAGLELYLPLISGARLVILSSDTAMDGYALAAALDQYHVTLMQATPATWRLLVDTGWAGRPGLKILCGGEPLPLALAEQLLDRAVELWNMYGPTETTIWSTLQRISREDALISIGRPIANTQVYILDAHLQPVPVGVTGALYIGGDGLARGYLNRPDLTAEKFIPHPFASDGRIYNTGDLARYLPDRRIECLGRGDSQVKIRGFRIELGEIEAVLAQHPSIHHAVVTVREDTPGDKRLVAYYTGEAAPTTRELSKFLRQQLPAYMIPAAYVALEAFPQTPNNKVDRRALPAPSQASAEAVKAHQPPATPAEILVGEVWKKALKVEQINVFDNFFDLGGHSLLAMQIIAAIQTQTGVRIEPAYLRIETLAQLAARLDEYTTRA